MPATEAQIRANQSNSKKSTGPVTDAGKQTSRSNSYKPGMTAKVVLPELEAAEGQRRFVAFCKELEPSGEVGMVLARHAAMMSVRMERCHDQAIASMSERARQAEADFLAPEGLDEPSIARLREEAIRRALFDASPEATLARRYEAAAERGLFRALKELRLMKTEKYAVHEAKVEAQLASILPANLKTMSDDEFEAFYAETMAKVDHYPPRRVESDDFSNLRGRVDVPFAVGKRR